MLRPHILIVDDTPANLLLLVRVLADRGCRTQAVLSGKLGLEAARAEPPDLILLDIRMPEMDGYEVCGQLKADAALRDIPVIFLSALHETEEKLKAFRVGGVDFVTKPFQLDEVCARIDTQLRLRRTERWHDELTHMIVHDLRNPLATICGFLEVLELQDGEKLSAGTQKLVEVARRGTQDLLRMISAILDVGDMRTGQMTLRRETCDVGDLVGAVVATTRPLPGNRTVTFDPPATPVTVSADPELLRRVMQNLLGNALKTTPAGGDVRIVVTPSASEVRVEVVDRGPGIAPEHQSQLFEQLGALERGTPRAGTGLSLTFCRLAIEALEGHIGVESKLGEGSTFWWALPRSQATLGPSREGAS